MAKKVATTLQKIEQDLADLDEGEVKDILTTDEKKFLLYVERGDVANVRQIVEKGKLENTRVPNSFNLNCVDPLGRSGLAISIENENMNMIDFLLREGIDCTDSLLHAINEEYIEGVETLLAHEERIHKPGATYSWQKLEGIRANYTPDITPLILAAHKDNYEILKLLLDRGAALPVPHEIKCACDECETSSTDDSLRHSLSRINAYKALCSPSLIALSSKDPLLTSFHLTEELRSLAILENEFRDDYTKLRYQVIEFAQAIIDKTRTSYELEVVLNYDTKGPAYEPGQRMDFSRLREAVNAHQKKFVAHANVQQLLGSVWYDGMPGFKRLGPIRQLVEVLKIAMMFPLYCICYIVAPSSKIGHCLTKPFIKFIVHSSSYLFFLGLLVVVSLRVETHLIEMFGTEWMIERLHEHQLKVRGSIPSFVELTIIVYICGFIKGEMMGLWDDGVRGFLKDLWNIVDFISNMFYVNWIFLRATAWYQTQRELSLGLNPYLPKEDWHPFDPMLISEGMFGAANIFSFLKLVHIFSVHPHLGPLQIALGRMVFDIMKFFSVFCLVLFAFGCGLNQLLRYYSDMDKLRCYSLAGGEENPDEELSCEIWRRFSSLFETFQSLFWASFGLVDIYNFDLTGIKSFTRFWGLLMFGSFNLINVIVLLNLLIAMMSNSYSTIVEKCDVEWKFARSRLWMSYFEENLDVPSPFNLIPRPWKAFTTLISNKPVDKTKQDELRDSQYQKVTRNLVRRFVTSQQMRHDQSEITEDDINELKQDLSSFKYELLNILRMNGMKTGNRHHKEDVSLGKKQQARERRLKKGFNIGLVEGIDLTKIFTKKIEKPLDFSELVLRALRSHKKDWNSSVKGASRRDDIGSSATLMQRQSLRSTRRKTPWNRVKYYQERGVFIGGSINPRVLTDAKTKMRRELRRPPPGWRRVQDLTNKGLITANHTSSTERNHHDPSMSIQQSLTKQEQPIVRPKSPPVHQKPTEDSQANEQAHEKADGRHDKKELQEIKENTETETPNEVQSKSEHESPESAMKEPSKSVPKSKFVKTEVEKSQGASKPHLKRN